MRGLCLFGTQFVETPWRQRRRPDGALEYEGLAFVPRSLLQCAFDPNVFDIDETPWLVFIDYLTKDQLLDRADQDPENWDPEQIQRAVDDGGGDATARHSELLQRRRTRAGYQRLPDFEVLTAYGAHRDAKRADARKWCIRIVNEKFVVSAFPNPSPTGNLPFKVGKYMEFELEPYARGVGSLGRLSQRDMEDNRRLYKEIIRMSLMNMWLKDRMSGIKNQDLKISPLRIIETEDMNGLRALLPNVEGAGLGLKLEEIFKEEFRGNTGATAGLQAQVTDASATDASIAQNEAIRRISVIAENIGESFVRDYQLEKHIYNLNWLEQDIWAAVTTKDNPVRVNRNTIAAAIDIYARITTDKDFRPRRVQNLLLTLQLLNSIRNRPNVYVDDLPLYEELVAAQDINPGRVIKRDGDIPPNNLLNAIMQSRNIARNQAQEMGPAIEGAGSGGQFTGSPGNVMETPVGLTLAS
jgi:hypothetical protein